MVIEIILNCEGKNRFETLLMLFSLFYDIPNDIINNEEKNKEIKEKLDFLDILYRLELGFIDRNQFLNELGLTDDLTNLREIPVIKKQYEKMVKSLIDDEPIPDPISINGEYDPQTPNTFNYIDALSYNFNLDFSYDYIRLINLFDIIENDHIVDRELLFNKIVDIIFINTFCFNDLIDYKSKHIKSINKEVILNIFISELDHYSGIIGFLEEVFYELQNVKNLHIRIMYIKNNNTISEFNVKYKIGNTLYKIINNKPTKKEKRILLPEQLIYENINKICDSTSDSNFEFNKGMLNNIKTSIILFGYNEKNKYEVIYYDIDGNLINNGGIAKIFINKHIIKNDELEKWIRYKSTQTLKIYNCDYDTDKYKKPIEKPTFSDEMKGAKRYNSNNILFYIFVSLIILVIISIIVSIIPFLHRCSKHHKFVQHNNSHL